MAVSRTKKTIAIYRQEGREGIKWDNSPGEEASQTFKTGAPLVRDSSSKEIEIWAGGTDTTAIEGVALHDASGTAATAVGYYEASPTNLFQGSIVNGTADIALAASHLGSKYSLVASGNDWYVDIADTTTTKVQIVGCIDPIGDTGARVVFRFLDDKQASYQNA